MSASNSSSKKKSGHLCHFLLWSMEFGGPSLVSTPQEVHIYIHLKKMKASIHSPCIVVVQLSSMSCYLHLFHIFGNSKIIKLYSSIEIGSSFTIVFMYMYVPIECMYCE